MMKKILLAILILFLPQAETTAQTLPKMWRKAKNQELLQPKDALRTIDTIIYIAKQRKEYGDLLRAELRRRQIILKLSQDSTILAIDSLKKEEREARWKDAVIQAIYSTILATLSVNDTTPYARMALERPELLQRIRVKPKTYRTITNEEFSGKYFNYDLLSIVGLILGNYDLLAERYTQAGNREAMFLIAFEKIRQQLPEKSQEADVRRFIAKLDSLGRAYSDIELSAETEILALQLAGSTELLADSLLLERCEKAIAKWKKYPRIGILKKMVDEKTRSNLWLEQWGVFPVSKKNRFLVRHRNVSRLKMRIKKVNDKNIVWDEFDTNDDDDLKELSKHTSRKLTKTIELPNRNKSKKYYSLVDLPTLPAGCYLMELLTKPETEVARAMFFVSNSRPIVMPLPGDSLRIAIVDAITSRPEHQAGLSFFGHRDMELDRNAEVRIGINDTTLDVLQLRSAEGIIIPIDLTKVGEFDKTRSGLKQVTNVFLDRKVYQPGETVHAVIVRHRNEGLKMLADTGCELQVKILDPTWQQVDSAVLKTDSYGTASAEFVLPKNMLSGNYHILVDGNLESFSVENYKRSTFSVYVQKPTIRYVLGDSVVVSGWARTLMDEPVRNAVVTYTLDGMPGDSLLTDSEGQFAIKIFLPKTPGHRHYNYFYLRGTVTDNTGEQEEFYTQLGVTNKRVCLDATIWDGLKERSELTDMRFILTNASAKLINGEVEYWFEGYEHLRHKAPCNVDLPFVVPSEIPDGIWKLVAVCEDDTLRRSFIVFSNNIVRPCIDTPIWFYQTSRNFGPNDSLPVTLQIGTSRRNVHVVYYVCNSERILEEGSFEMSDTILYRELKYKPEYADGISLYYAWFVDGEFYDYEFNINRLLPETKLNLTWETFRNKLVPGDEETWRLKITDPAGRPITAQLMATLYDAALDKLQANKWQLETGLRLCVPNVEQALPEKFLGSDMYFSSTASERKYSYPHLSLGTMRKLMEQGTMRKLMEPGTMKDGNSKPITKRLFTGSSTAVHVRGLTSLYGARSQVKETFMDISGVRIDPNKFQPVASEAKRRENLPVRTNLKPLAFFVPRLESNNKGEAVLKFTLPESVTAWRFIGLAHTRNMLSGTISSTAVAKKSIMVQPNMPRFLRKGDTATISCRVFNTSEKNLEGRVYLCLVDPTRERVVHNDQKYFSLRPDSTGTISFDYRPYPDDPPVLICEIMASADDTNDGEQHYLPVIDNKEPITQTIPFEIDGVGTKRISIDELISKLGDDIEGFPQFTIECANNPTALVLGALHEYAHPVDGCAICQAIAYYSLRLGRHIVGTSAELCDIIRRLDSLPDSSVDKQSALLRNEELKNVLPAESPWLAKAKAETNALRELTVFLPGQPLDGKEALLVRKLAELQQADGSWAWMSGMPGNRNVTKSIMLMLLRLNKLIGEQPDTRSMLNAAFAYLAKEPTLDELYLMALDNRTDRKQTAKLLNELRSQLSELDILSLARAAVLFHHSGDTRTAREIVSSLKQHTVTTPDGCRFYDTRRANYSWFDYQIPSQVAAIEAISLVTPADSSTIREMLKWLFREKQTQYWSTAIQSADAIYALLGSATARKHPSAPPIIKFDGQAIVPSAETSSSVLGYRKETVNMTRQHELQIQSTSDGIVWGALYSHLVQKGENIKPSGSELKIVRDIIPLQSGPLHVGSRVKVRITVTSTRNLDFIQIVDKRAACLESVTKHSGYRYGSDVGYYLDRKADRTVYFIDKLARGTHIIEEVYYLDRAGTYTTGSLTAQCAYAPAFAALAPPTALTVKP